MTPLTRKLLFIYDEEFVTEYFSTQYRVLGYDVATASSVEEGIEAAREFNPEVIVSELAPGHPFTERFVFGDLLDFVDNEMPNTKVILLTTFVVDGLADKIKDRVFAIFTKPSTNEEITDGIERAFGIRRSPKVDEAEEEGAKEFQYEIALSFAGEQRDYVERVAELLRENQISVFYDRFEEAQLWGRNLYDHLQEVYREKSKFTVIFCSQDYAKKLWTDHERQSAQERAFRENEAYILPAKFDDTEIPGIPSTVGYVDLRSRTPEQLYELIAEKLNKTAGQSNQSGTSASQSGLSTEANELLDLIRSEDDHAQRGVVEIMKSVVPMETHFFARLVYAGSPMAMKTRLFRAALAELVDKNWLFPPQYDESTDTQTYEFRNP